MEKMGGKYYPRNYHQVDKIKRCLYALAGEFKKEMNVLRKDLRKSWERY